MTENKVIDNCNKVVQVLARAVHVTGKIYSVVNLSRCDMTRRNETIDARLFRPRANDVHLPLCRVAATLHFISFPNRSKVSHLLFTVRRLGLDSTPVSSRLVSFTFALPFRSARYALPIKPAIVKPQLTNARDCTPKMGPGPPFTINRFIELAWSPAMIHSN